MSTVKSNINGTNPWLVDVSVLLLFHARADHFSEVWNEVRRARPSRLFLYQDGPRGERDMPGIMACRELVKDENIDWKCEVYRLYQEKNYGCDPSEFISQRWAFSLTDKCIVLEDDDVPSQSFFPFCKEMLDRYENDESIVMISGFNVSHPSDTKDSCGKGSGIATVCDDNSMETSYFFTRAFSIWGWASWARVVNNWDGEYGFVKNPVQFAELKQKSRQYRQRDDMVRMCENHASQGKAFYETIFWAYMMLHDGLAVMPSVNLINNIGLDGGTHYSAQLELLPRRLRWQFIMPRMELSFPLNHPKEVTENYEYQKQFYLLNAWNNPFRKVQYSIEELWLNLRHGNFEKIKDSLINRIYKWLHINRGLYH